MSEKDDDEVVEIVTPDDDRPTIAGYACGGGRVELSKFDETYSGRVESFISLI